MLSSQPASTVDAKSWQQTMRERNSDSAGEDTWTLEIFRFLILCLRPNYTKWVLVCVFYFLTDQLSNSKK